MPRVAAIDCGTNSIRLLVADAPDGAAGGLTDVLRRMEVVRLGQGVDRTGRLAPEAIERTRVALAEYTAQLIALGAERVRMVATSATRDAANADEFRDMVQATLGAPPEVVSGAEEARLSFTGAVRGLAFRGPFLVLDIGGGSTEFVVGNAAIRDPAAVPAAPGSGATPDGARASGALSTVDDPAGMSVAAAISMDIGCVRMTERHLHSDPPAVAEVLAATADIEAAVEHALRAVSGRDAATVVGLAGSVTTVAAIALELPAYRPDVIHHSVLTLDQVQRVTADLLAMTRAQRLALPVMHPGRADVIGAGALILRVIMERATAGSVVVSEHDILDGIAASIAG